MNPQAEPYPATLSDLDGIEGKAELINDRIVRYPHMGVLPAEIVWNLVRALDDWCTATGVGEAYTGGLIYAVPRLPSGRQSFCADGSYYDGPPPANRMSWVENPPTFAAEVRRKEDYENPNVEVERAAKRADYFAAGTLAVWDVYPIESLVKLYTAADPTAPVTFGPGDTAHAEPAVPGWRLAVDELFA